MSTEKNHKEADQSPDKEQAQEQLASAMEPKIETDAQPPDNPDDAGVMPEADSHNTSQSEPDHNHPVQETPGRNGWIIPLLAMFILFAGGGVLLWLEQQQLGQQLQQSELRNGDIRARLDKSQQQQRQAINANSELQHSMQTMQDMILAQQQAPQQGETTLLLHQALMLVRMAQAQLQVRHNVADAVRALQWAQQRMQAHNDSRITAVRSQLERDIQQLENLPQHNQLALAQQLASRIDTVDQLPLRIAVVQSLQSAATNDPQPAPEYTGWRSAIKVIWQELKQLVVIRHREQPIQPIMTVERKQILHDVLRLRLEALQVQLMRDALAAQNVARARALSWLRKWFDEGNADVISLRDWLNSMPQTSTALPDLQDSVTAITSAMEQTATLADPAP
ncbi:MAG TPA: hypothetical protein ENI64_08935 [Gammaproteobacteria bacterium]|nr:hypothetical protein [Gammaproteobacteria bacterium]